MTMQDTQPAREPAWVRRRRTLDVLDFIKAELAAGRKFPRGTAIARHMGWKNAASGNDALSRLAWAGRLKVVSRTPTGRGWSYVYEIVEG